MTPAARRRALPAVLLAVVLVAVVSLALRPASAARLPLTGGQLMTGTGAPCAATSLGAAPGAAGSSGTATQVLLTGVPAACRGQVATVRLFAADGSALAAADTTVTLAAADSTTVTVPSYPAARVAGVALTVGTWSLPTSWTTPAGAVTGPVTPGPGTTFTSVTWSQLAASGTQACVTVALQATPGTDWRVDLHLDQRPFNGVTSGAGFVVTDPWWARVQSVRPVDGVVSVGAWIGSGTLSPGQTLSVTVCHYGLPAPVYDPALPYTQSTTAVTGSGGYACTSTTVGVSGTPQFYAGWRADVDVAPLVAYFTARGVTPDLRTLTAPGNHTVTARGGTVYRVTPTAWDTWGVRDDTTRTFQLCLRG
ncbi:hypothetical protein [Cellulomonas sp. Marseille-Q8402]